MNLALSNDQTTGVELWEKLFAETVGKSPRPPFEGTIQVNSQVLDLFDHGNQFFYFVDYVSSRILYVSPNIVNVLGFKPDEYDLSKVYETIHPEDRKAVFEIGKMVINREQTNITGFSHNQVDLYVTYRTAKKNGRYTRISRTVSRHIDAGRIFEMAVIRDISHVHCGTMVTVSLLGGRPLKELPAVTNGGPAISRREQEIIYYISQGYTSRRIAYELNISELTVNTHRRNIMRKTGKKNLVDLLLYAANNGIV